MSVIYHLFCLFNYSDFIVYLFIGYGQFTLGLKKGYGQTAFGHKKGILKKYHLKGLNV